PPPPEPSPSPDVIEETPVPATEEEQAPVATEPPAPAEPEAAPEADQGGAAGQEPATEETPAPAAAGDGQDQKPAPQTENPLENLRMTMIRLLSSLLGEIQKVRPNLDAYNLFGIDLVLAGAIDFLGTEKKLSQEEKSTILRETIEVMGTRADIARSFADKYEDYLGEPKYLSMVQVGRSSMEALLAGADLAGEEMMAAFTLWNRPQPTTQTAPGTITVLFTDMVGSTDFTQSRGDHAAQDILRRHNSIVRSALAEFVGREIKHTGDGIMASFASAANGVEAAISIQRACEAHNARNPDLPLHLRIGLNSGEPIQEGDDLFGTTVQLSARVCAKAAANEILCTNVVRELSAGKDLTFDSKGIQELKGFKDPVPLYAVRWALPVETSTSGPVPAGGGDADPDSASVKGPETTRTSTKASAPKARKEGKTRPRAAARPSEPPEAPKA
ncbi:MAG: hypothetical protein F8N37_04025, partial [Telmatospirillum sp.]|nr:hypothetical protein [Telmatospirillum sp.]